MPRRPFSLCIITHNEEANLPRCLASVPFADDVVVLDSGSTDGTLALAQARGARVFSEPFRGHVAQKARAVALAQHRWVLCLDADEEVSATLASSLLHALEGLPPESDNQGPAAYALARKTSYCGRFIEHSGWWPEWRVRLFDRERGRWVGEDPHDRVEVDGAVVQLAGALHHFAYRDLAHHLEKVNRYTSTMAAGMAERGERFHWFDVLLRPPARFLRMYLLRRGFLDGARGLLLATIGAFYVFLKYAKLWELTRAPPRAREKDPRT